MKLIHLKKQSQIFVSIRCFFLFLLICNNSFSQDEKSTKYILLRGKVSSFVIIEDTFWRNANIGAEFRLLNKHSIGVDYVFFRWRHQNDSIINGIEYPSGFNAFSKRNYINIDYRYYPFKDWSNKYNIDFYANTFVKIGKRKIWTEDDSCYYPESRFYGVSNQMSNYTDYGFALGFRKILGLKDRFGIDVNIGFAKRFSDISYQKSYDWAAKTTTEKLNVNESKWIIHMRLNLYFQIKNLI